jgi:hypothetical protein
MPPFVFEGAKVHYLNGKAKNKGMETIHGKRTDPQAKKMTGRIERERYGQVIFTIILSPLLSLPHIP